MKKIIKPLFSVAALGLMFSLSGCLKQGLDELQNSNQKVMTSVDYTYRFLYTDTIQKGTSKQEILTDRVCEVLFKKNVVRTNENGLDGFKTTLSYDVNSVLKAGPTGSVTKAMLFTEFDKLIRKDQLSKLWVYVTVSDVSTVSPLADAPKLGSPGDFSKDHVYQVKAADGSTKDYLIRTIKGF
ncbi:hypothetical protein OQX61_14800 [Pedobacter sp. PLR]|uniref:DUF5018-related domain-containing protein n=1 Tax=Pedobacter sp. PLR TaxID=2994465 RepID=UPI002246A515|nr:hypothetical protein [Pedobacter sp. PLR]MCX2452543.1 hypothetical protein [Pedobacter sp. PLR]